MTNQWFGFAVTVPQTSHLNSVTDAIETISPSDLIRAWRAQTTRSFYTESKIAADFLIGPRPTKLLGKLAALG
jgi:hypothetical protein